MPMWHGCRHTPSRWAPHDRSAIAGRRPARIRLGATVSLKEKIRERKARIGVIGLGYVGLPLAVEFAKRGFDVTGFDVDESKVRDITAGRSYILDVKTQDVASNVNA